MDVETFLAPVRAASGITVKTLPNSNYLTGIGFFASQTFENSELIRYYCGFLVYAKLSMEWHETKTYGRGGMQVTAEAFTN